jgi:hypothetical protein
VTPEGPKSDAGVPQARNQRQQKGQKERLVSLKLNKHKKRSKVPLVNIFKYYKNLV